MYTLSLIEAYALFVIEVDLEKKGFWKDGLCFSCTQCSRCCRFDPGFVYLSKCDLQKLQQWAGMSSDAVIKKYCRWVLQSDSYEYLCLKELSNYDCVLWNQGCIAYQYRPFQCSSYPFWDYFLENEQRWTENAADCHGINCGKKYSATHIQELLSTAKRFPPIRRKKNASAFGM